MNRKKVAVNHLQISYLDNEVQGPPVLFIHGNSGSGESFSYLFDTAEFFGYRVLSPDLPGHGESSRDDRSAGDYRIYSVNYFSDILATFLDVVEANQPLIVGHSLGGHIALHLSEMVEVRGIMFLGISPLENYRDVEKAFLRRDQLKTLFTEAVSDEKAKALGTYLFQDDKHREVFSRHFRAADGRVRRNLGLSMGPGAEFGEVSLIKKISFPLSFCLGDRDPLINEEYVRNLLAEIDREKDLFILPDCGHFPQIEQPRRLNLLAAGFFKATGAGR